jgi:hypothetical protein
MIKESRTTSLKWREWQDSCTTCNLMKTKSLWQDHFRKECKKVSNLFRKKKNKEKC